ncbi:CcoQ/FixQ family Cbb3-type cytochrome c oxidase assembly chaperone [Christiangramia fulva]|uniref:CcoQ/FixQ family Cbb3-type cytochrome c oxidase assembly chaperone n=1 Tax=Christiangramia fulva TaxID=2126553 RepID=A0A2R3Z243_9FLAO|nr:CcoQ/FixQ family Cbb3-type cytochrome c oxidase assembly chaperone [Christiangramia fulva]AVR44351.1 CcoQ/FixQ family Cbb3-type cytochrome c oxidase assembly chaperone [Christiangramia fulva]
MLKYVKGPLESIDGVAIYPIISLLIFFIFFAALFFWVVTARKEYINEVSQLPLEKEEADQENSLDLTIN